MKMPTVQPQKPAKGKLLLSEPMLQDPNFRRTVVLLCEHNSDGSFGLIINKPIPITLNEVMPGQNLPDIPLYIGGPVQPDTLHILHKLGEAISGAQEITPGVYWGGDFDEIRQMLTLGVADEEDCRFFIGYSGWAEGQLQDEMDQGGWLVADNCPDYSFTGDPDHLWRQILKDMGGDYSILSNFPENPKMN